MHLCTVGPEKLIMLALTVAHNLQFDEENSGNLAV